MELAPTRYVRIEGTEVTVAVTSAEEARAAIKELKHKKKEYAWLKKAITRQIQAVERSRKRMRPAKKTRGQTWLARVASVVDDLTRGPEIIRAGVAAGDLPAMRRECKKIDDILHNLDSAVLQVEGRLLHHSF
ncbi:MAG TPA: hypothetical protein VNK52_07835 [Hyphomicrobiaceae bacterium]|nr:hypothetical protein [Hyphomicrobiaceae bacterium]